MSIIADVISRFFLFISVGDRSCQELANEFDLFDSTNNKKKMINQKENSFLRDFLDKFDWSRSTEKFTQNEVHVTSFEFEKNLSTF